MPRIKLLSVLELDVVVAYMDFRRFQTDFFIIADAIHLIAYVFAKLCHVTGIGSKVEQIERRA